MALATGAAAFVVAAVVLTGTELVFGGRATSDSGRTTLFGVPSRDAHADGQPAGPRRRGPRPRGATAYRHADRDAHAHAEAPSTGRRAGADNATVAPTATP